MIFRGMRGRISGCVQRRGAEDGAVGLGPAAGTQPLLRRCQHQPWPQSTGRCSRANAGPGGTGQAAGLWHLLCPSARGSSRHVTEGPADTATGIPWTRHRGSHRRGNGSPTDVAPGVAWTWHWKPRPAVPHQQLPSAQAGSKAAADLDAFLQNKEEGARSLLLAWARRVLQSIVLGELSPLRNKEKEEKPRSRRAAAAPRQVHPSRHSAASRTPRAPRGTAGGAAAPGSAQPEGEAQRGGAGRAGVSAAFVTFSLSFFFFSNNQKRKRTEKDNVPVPESTAAGNVNIWRGEKKKKKATKDQMMRCNGYGRVCFFFFNYFFFALFFFAII